jgi:hypothetical protein
MLCIPSGSFCWRGRWRWLNVDSLGNNYRDLFLGAGFGRLPVSAACGASRFSFWFQQSFRLWWIFRDFFWNAIWNSFLLNCCRSFHNFFWSFYNFFGSCLSFFCHLFEYLENITRYSTDIQNSCSATKIIDMDQATSMSISLPSQSVKRKEI